MVGWWWLPLAAAFTVARADIVEERCATQRSAAAPKDLAAEAAFNPPNRCRGWPLLRKLRGGPGSRSPRDVVAGAADPALLEGGVIAVAERDDYEVRAPRMYYDFQNDRAIMVDAVLRTYDRQRRAPVVARADELRQLAEGQWSADNVVLSASSFATPTLALASRKAMLTRTAPTMDAQIETFPMIFLVFVESGSQRLDCACAVGFGFGLLVFTLWASSAVLAFSTFF